MTTPAVDRVLARVDKQPDGCWIFTGHIARNGYGQVGLGARSEGIGYTHRVVFEALVGPIPDGYDIDHLCRVRACCRPDHLDAVPRQTNLLRGRGWTSANASKTHCKRGHEFTPENTRHDGRGRQCRTCDQIRRHKERAA